MTETLLQVKGLEKHFVHKQGWQPKKLVYAVDGVSFEIRRGSTLGLVGESGCGKSTLGMSILRLLEPTGGEVHFDGTNILDLKPKDMRRMRKRMQIIFQDPYSSLNPRMRVSEILAEPLNLHFDLSSKEREKRISGLLEKVGLDAGYASRYPHEFSGGQRQRIGVARAISLSPEFIIADEPVSALDVSIQSQILNLLNDLKKELNLSFLFVAHDLAVVEHISDFVAVMYLGRIVEYAPAENIFSHPMHPYTVALTHAVPMNKTKGEDAVLEGDVPSPMNPPSGCHFHPRCPLATDLCRQKSPELSDRSKGHKVACHHV